MAPGGFGGAGACRDEDDGAGRKRTKKGPIDCGRRPEEVEVEVEAPGRLDGPPARAIEY